MKKEEYVLESYADGQLACHFTYDSKEDALDSLNSIIMATIYCYINEELKINYHHYDNHIEVLVERNKFKQTIFINPKNIEL